MGESVNPLVSIVTPSYNQGRFIRQTIESVLSQDYAPIEYMVIDGGSTDETLEVLKSYGDRFYWVCEKDQGQSNAINKGWSRARGEILAWLNSDDIYLPGAISKAVAFLQKNPKVGPAYGEGYHIEENGRILERYPTEPFSRQRLKETCYICQPTVFIPKAVLDEVGLLDESLEYCMDYDLWFRIAKKYAFGYVPGYLACTRFHSETKTRGQRFKAHKEILAVVHRYTESVPPSWIYGYGHAFLERFFDRSKPWENLFFVIGLIGLSMGKFLQYNHRTPFSEYHRWWEWLRHNFKWKLLLGSSQKENNEPQIIDDKGKRD